MPKKNQLLFVIGSMVFTFYLTACATAQTLPATKNNSTIHPIPKHNMVVNEDVENVHLVKGIQQTMAPWAPTENDSQIATPANVKGGVKSVHVAA